MRRWIVSALGPVLLVHCKAERTADRAPPVVVPVATIGATAAPPTSASDMQAVPSAPPSGSGRSIPGDCRAAAADAEKIMGSAKPSHGPIDLDHDGTPDCMFSSCTSNRCRTLLYRVEPGHVRLVGDLATSPLSEPRCIDPSPSTSRTNGGLCRLSVHELMIHGDEQEYFYEHTDGAYRKVGIGRRTDPEPP